jgi:hypothetical protein
MSMQVKDETNLTTSLYRSHQFFQSDNFKKKFFIVNVEVPIEVLAEYTSAMITKE